MKNDSPLNRRVTPQTPIRMAGPRAHIQDIRAQMVTRWETACSMSRGTLNNCGHGKTPWGTYLTCEENWAFFFRRSPADDSRRSPRELISFKRYGIAGKGAYLWATVQPDAGDNRFGRWDASVTGTSSDGSDDYRNAPNTFGWVVEIDPFDPTSTPRKRTALGRFAHEGAWPGPVIPGQPQIGRAHV